MPSDLIRKSIKTAIDKIKFNQNQSILLVKLAGIGDVAMACRALNDFFKSTLLNLELHWVIDESYVKLAESLLTLPENIRVSFCPIKSSNLFQGNSIEKAKESLKIAQYVAETQPRAAVLLHRDWRYLAFLRPFFTGSIIKLKKEPIHELDAYRIALNRLTTKFELSEKKVEAEQEEKSTSVSKSEKMKIGILLGGASGTKLTYYEKRWTSFVELIEQILGHTQHDVYLFGSSGDRVNLEELSRSPVYQKNQERVYNNIGELKLNELARNLSGLDRFISIDSGLLHIASIVMNKSHQKIIGIYGPTNPSIWGPVASGSARVQVLYKFKSCSPCYLDDGKFVPCKYTGDQFQHCMSEIKVSEALSALLS